MRDCSDRSGGLPSLRAPRGGHSPGWAGGALQTDLDAFLSFYNERRAHQGYRTQGRTPLQTFTEHQRATEAPQVA
jgi:hypothetical protein